MNIDLKPLEQKSTAKEISEFRALPDRQYYEPESRGSSAAYVMIMSGLLGGLPIGLFVAGFIASTSNAPAWLVMPPIALPFIAASVYIPFLITNSRNKKRSRYGQKVHAFVKANPSIQSSVLATEKAKGIIFIGYNSMVPDSILLFNGESPFFVGSHTLRYQTSDGVTENRTWGYIGIDLPRKLPRIILDSVSNEKSLLLHLINPLSVGPSGSLPDFIKGHQQLSLEGNFDDYFRLYVPPGYEQDALYIFTPDVMAMLIDTLHTFDIEIVDNILYIYQRGAFNLTDPNEIQRILALVEKFGAKFREQTKMYTSTNDTGANPVSAARVGDPSDTNG